MIETSDVNVNVWRYDGSPFPTPPVHGTFSGVPQFLDRPPPGQMRLNVGESYVFTTRMRGTRPITIAFQQEIMYGGTRHWRTITSFQLHNDQLGFTLQIFMKDRHAGFLKLRYQAGGAIWEQELVVNQRCACS